MAAEDVPTLARLLLEVDNLEQVLLPLCTIAQQGDAARLPVERELEVSRNENALLRERLSNLRASENAGVDIAELVKEKASLELRFNHTVLALADATAQRDSALQHIASLQFELAESTSQLAESRNTEATLRVEMHGLASQVGSLTASNNKLKEDGDASELALNRARDEAAESRRALADSHAALEAVVQKHERLVSMIHAAKKMQGGAGPPIAAAAATAPGPGAQPPVSAEEARHRPFAPLHTAADPKKRKL